MTEQALKEVFKRAEDLIKDLPDILKPQAFYIAVQNLTEKPIFSQETIQPKQKELTYDEGDGFFSKLVSFTSISIQLLKTVYKLDKEGSIEIIISNIDGKIPDMQKKITLLYLLANMMGNEQEWTSTLSLVPQLKKFGVNDSNVPRNLKKERGILQSGSSHGKQYSLSPVGIKSARQLLEELTKI